MIGYDKDYFKLISYSFVKDISSLEEAMSACEADWVKEGFTLLTENTNKSIMMNNKYIIWVRDNVSDTLDSKFVENLKKDQCECYIQQSSSTIWSAYGFFTAEPFRTRKNFKSQQNAKNYCDDFFKSQGWIVVTEAQLNLL